MSGTKFPFTKTEFQTWLSLRHRGYHVKDNYENIFARFGRSLGRTVTVNSKKQIVVDGRRVTAPTWAKTLVTATKSSKISTASGVLAILAD